MPKIFYNFKRYFNKKKYFRKKILETFPKKQTCPPWPRHFLWRTVFYAARNSALLGSEPHLEPLHRTSVWKAGVSRHQGGLLQVPFKSPWTSRLHATLRGSEGAPNWYPIIPRHEPVKTADRKIPIWQLTHFHKNQSSLKFAQSGCEEGKEIENKIYFLPHAHT